MDSFKTVEVERMRLGGNKPWRDFFNAHSSNKVAGRDFEGCTIAERYDSEAGEEWKERLTAKVEGREYVPVPKAQRKEMSAVERGRTGVTPVGSGRNTPVPTPNSTSNPAIRSPPPAAQRGASPSQKARNEAFFSRMGEENASRPDNLPPSQGGKFSGFGSGPPPSSSSNLADSQGIPTSDEFQRDPMAALTKGFGWLSSTVTKQAANVNKAYIQPGVKSLAEGDFAAQARATALNAGTFVQQGAKGVGDSFNKFVDPEYGSNSTAAAGGSSVDTRRRVEPEKKDFWDSFGQAPAGPPKEKKDFWDDFAAAGDVVQRSNSKGSTGKSSSSIGTSAMKTNTGTAAGKKEEGGDEWGSW